MKTIWSFLKNVFDTITLHSFRKMDSLSLYHDLKLLNNIGDAAIAAIYALFHPIRLAYHEAYTAYKTALAASREANQVTEDMLAVLSSNKLDEWDVGIRNVYHKDTPIYTGFFPNGHKPFHHGRYEERITYVEALRDSIGADPALAAVKADIISFITDYNVALANKLGAQDDIKKCLDTLRVVRRECAVAMFANLGKLISLNAATPEVTGNYFDLEQIRRSTPKEEGGTSEELTISIPAGGFKEGGFPFTDTDVFLFYDSGITKLAVNTSPSPVQPMPPPEALIMHPEDEAEKMASVLGTPGNRFLIITNLDPLNDGEITINIAE